MSILKNKGLWIGGLIVVIAIAMIIGFQVLGKETLQPLSPERIAELREQYPAYNEDPEFVTMKSSSFMEIVDIAETVIIGEVISELPPYEVDLGKLGEVHEKIGDKQASQGLPIYKPSFVQYEVQVEKVVRGEPVKDTILLAYNSDFVGYEPKLEKGMKIVSGVSAGQELHEGKHFFTRFGTYYIVDDHYVLSAVDDSYSKLMNGPTLDSLINEIVARK